MEESHAELSQSLASYLFPCTASRLGNCKDWKDQNEGREHKFYKYNVHLNQAAIHKITMMQNLTEK